MAEITIHHDGPIVSKQDALLLGSKYFFTGRPCGRNHIAQRTISRGHCVRCAMISADKFREQKRHRDRPRARQRYHNTKEARVHYLRKRARDYYWRKQAILIEKIGRPKPLICDICESPARKICFDHCHVSGEFRGWLCNNCNATLGLVKDRPELLRKLALYLERNSTGTSDV